MSERSLEAVGVSADRSAGENVGIDDIARAMLYLWRELKYPKILPSFFPHQSHRLTTHSENTLGQHTRQDVHIIFIPPHTSNPVTSFYLILAYSKSLPSQKGSIPLSLFWHGINKLGKVGQNRLLSVMPITTLSPRVCIGTASSMIHALQTFHCANSSCLQSPTICRATASQEREQCF